VRAQKGEAIPKDQEGTPFETDPADWTARLNTKLPDPPRLHIGGRVTFFTGGWTCTLEPPKFPDFNSKYYTIRIAFAPPTGGSTNALDSKELNLDQTLPSGERPSIVRVTTFDADKYKPLEPFEIAIQEVT